MPFVLKVHEGHRTGLIAVCDVCGKQVTGADANILWKPHAEEVAGKTTHPFLIVCKGACDRKFEKSRGHHFYQNLDTAIGYLIHNLKLDLKQVRRNMEALGRLE